MVRPSRSRPCLSPNSLEHTLNVSFVLLNLLSLVHWTCWLTWVVPTSHLSEARVELHVQDTVTGWHDNWAELSGSQSQRRYSSFCHQIPSTEFWCSMRSQYWMHLTNIGPFSTCTIHCTENLPPSQAWQRHTFENKSGGSTLNDTMLPSFSSCKHEPSSAAGDNFTHHKLLRNNSLCTSLRTSGVFCSDTDTHVSFPSLSISPPQQSQTGGRHHLIQNNE